jgi:uncharacterized membrane protein YczE
MLSHKNTILRYLLFVAGILINSFGIAFITKAALGTSPISSVPYVLSLGFPLTLGEFSFIMNMIFIFLEIILLRRNFQLFQLLQIVVNVIFSYFIDFSMEILEGLQPSNYVIQIICLLIGCMILAIGISIEVSANVLMVPGEGLVKAISTVTHKEFGTIKVMFDVTLMVISLVLSLIFFRELQGIREGTIISALLVGQFVKLCYRKIPFIKCIPLLQNQQNAA